jgi:hypothetical protein
VPKAGHKPPHDDSGFALPALMHAGILNGMSAKPRSTLEPREATHRAAPRRAAAEGEIRNAAAKTVDRVQPSAPMHPGTRRMVELMARITYRRMKRQRSLPVPSGEGIVN